MFQYLASFGIFWQCCNLGVVVVGVVAVTVVMKESSRHLVLRMHYVGYAELAAAVSNAGGLGTD